jgi:hypothetical protein
MTQTLNISFFGTDAVLRAFASAVPRIDGQTCVPCRHWHGHGRVVPRLSTTLPCWCAYRVVPRRAGVPASQPRHYTKEAEACRVVLLGTAAQQSPCQPRHDVGAQVQTKHRFTKCPNTKIHSFKVTTHKENARLYTGGEGRPGSTITREGQPGSNSYRACPVPAAGAGRAVSCSRAGIAAQH